MDSKNFDFGRDRFFEPDAIEWFKFETNTIRGEIAAYDFDHATQIFDGIVDFDDQILAGFVEAKNGFRYSIVRRYSLAAVESKPETDNSANG